METTIQAKTISGLTRGTKSINAEVKSKQLSDFWKMVEFNRFGIIAMVLIVVTCLGGIAAAVAVQKSTFQLALVGLTTMSVEAFVLAVMPMRSIVFASIISLVVSLLVIIL